KTVVPGKNLQSAEHDLEVAKATAENNIASTKATLTAARRHLLILGLKDSAIDGLVGRPGCQRVQNNRYLACLDRRKRIRKRLAARSGGTASKSYDHSISGLSLFGPGDLHQQCRRSRV